MKKIIFKLLLLNAFVAFAHAQDSVFHYDEIFSNKKEKATFP